MLSPGDWHARVPKGRADNLRFRLELGARCHADPALRRTALAMCRDDILFYVNAFCWTFDPRTRDKSLPFVAWPVQDRAFLVILDCIERGKDLIIEKSRDMGASWMSLMVMEWLWHFHPGNSFLMISRNEKLVDGGTDESGTPASLFWKIDFVHKMLPTWLRPDTVRKRLHFGNADNGSSIDGEATTAAISVGDRRTAIFLDEFSRIEQGYEVLAGTADATNCRIFNFTPYGTNNAAYRLARREDVRKLRLHWSDHPEKAKGLYRYHPGDNRIEVLDKAYEYPPDYQFLKDAKFPLGSPWFDDERRRRANDREVSQMLEIDYAGSEYQFFDKILVLTLQQLYARPAAWEGDVGFDPDTGRPAGLVKASGGPLKLWCQLDRDDRPPAAPYAAGADISAGTGATPSCLSLVDAATGEKVGEYTTPYLRPDQFAPRVTALCWLFKDEHNGPARLCWESQGPGTAFGKKAIELGYGNYYRREANQMLAGGKVSDIPGFFPSPDNTRLALEEYRTALSCRDFLNRSHQALEECLSFVHASDGTVRHANEDNRGDPTGARVNHGDRVIADALAWKMARQLGVLSRKTVEAQHAAAGPTTLAGRRALWDGRRKADAWGV